MADDDGRCPNCGEDEMDGARCYYCGFHLYDCEMPDCSWCEQYHGGVNPAAPLDTADAQGES